jgi:hypothetical protein
MGFELFPRKPSSVPGGKDTGRTDAVDYARDGQPFPSNAAEDVVTGRSIPPTSEFVGTAEAILKRFRERAG